MKKINEKLRIILIPLILCTALIFTGMLSVRTIKNLQGNARIINYAGIVRGASQRLVKNELYHIQNDDLIKDIDEILDGLAYGNESLDLIQLDSDKFQNLIEDMRIEWVSLKETIALYRNNDRYEKDVYMRSEAFFHLANQSVLAAETYTEEVVEHARNLLFYVNIIFIAVAIASGVFAYIQEERRKKLLRAEEENLRKTEQLNQKFKDLLVPINEISELMYVSDIENYELLFANDAGKRTFHLKEGEKVKCYKALQGLDAPCSFCPNQLIGKDETYTYEHTNAITKRHYLLKDHLMEWEGRPAKMEIAFDITDAENEKRELKNRLERDHLLVECIREFYQNQHLLDAANVVMERIGKLFTAERAYVYSFQKDTLSNIVEWCGEQVEPQIHRIQNIPITNFTHWLSMFDEQKSVFLTNIEDIKDTLAYEYEFLKQQGIQRVIMVPIERDGKLDGCIGLDNPNESLMESALTFLETIRYYIMLAMRRDEDQKELVRLSFTDILTSFYNRNRYLQDIVMLAGCDKAMGVVYLDINGLKEVNDQQGHDAGDALLQACAHIMRDSFENADYYRIGGDEFIILLRDCEEAAFMHKVACLKENFMQSSYRAAIGYRWADNCHDLESMIKQADVHMYEDKEKFYHEHYERRRNTAK